MNISDLTASARLAKSLSEHLAVSKHLGFTDSILAMQRTHAAEIAQQFTSISVPKELLNSQSSIAAFGVSQAFADSLRAPNVGALQALARGYQAILPSISLKDAGFRAALAGVAQLPLKEARLQAAIALTPQISWKESGFHAAWKAMQLLTVPRAPVGGLLRELEATTLWHNNITEILKTAGVVSDLFKSYRNNFDLLTDSVSRIVERFDIDESDLEAEEVVVAFADELRVFSAEANVASSPLPGIDIENIVERIIARLPSTDSDRKLSYQVIVPYVLMIFLWELIKAAMGGLAEVEYGRMRNAEDDVAQLGAEAEQTRIATAQLEKLQQILEILEHPPHEARVAVRAHLRRDASVESESLGILRPGLEVTEIRRERGWAYVTAELGEGAPQTGWVYARFLRPVERRAADESPEH